ncbi:MAG: TIGR00341 family protein [Thainema sp.]
MAKRRSLLRFAARLRRFRRNFWKSNSGDWRWLAEKPVTIAALNKILWRESVPSLSFFVMLSLSGIISTLGLLAGSTATVIGAMIIAPLMGPIIGMAYALAIANRRLFKRAALTLLAGTLATIISATVITWLIGLRTLNPEITARTQPTLIDLGVALAAGAAGAFAKSRRHVADSFPGVAIAVALVPPLSVIGIGIAFGDLDVLIGASLLFLTNLTAIIFSGIMVCLWQRYGSLARAQSGLTASLLVLGILGVPLGFSLNNLLVNANVRQQVLQIIQDQLSPVEQAEIASLTVRSQSGQLLIQMELMAPPNSVSDLQIQTVHSQISKELQTEVDLQVQIVPTRKVRIPASPAQG